MPNTAKFPSAIATNLDLLVATDNATCTLSGTITSSATTILTSIQSPPIQTPCAVSIDNEIILIGSGTTTQLNEASPGQRRHPTTMAQLSMSTLSHGRITSLSPRLKRLRRF